MPPNSLFCPCRCLSPYCPVALPRQASQAWPGPSVDSRPNARVTARRKFNLNCSRIQQSSTHPTTKLHYSRALLSCGHIRKHPSSLSSLTRLDRALVMSLAHSRTRTLEDSCPLSLPPASTSNPHSHPSIHRSTNPNPNPQIHIQIDQVTPMPLDTWLSRVTCRLWGPGVPGFCYELSVRLPAQLRGHFSSNQL